MGPRLLRQCHELPSQLFRLQEPARCGQAVQTLPEHRAQARVVLRWVAGGEHQHHITRVGIFTLGCPPRKASASAVPVMPRAAASSVSFSGSRPDRPMPAALAACRLRRRVQLPAQSGKPGTAPLQPGG